jgi:AraC-like DNA-binding protein
MFDSNEVVIQKAVAFLNSNLKYKITIAIVAKTVGVSEPRIKRLFRETFGMGIFHYHRKQKIEFAKEKLLHGSSVKEACLYIGYGYETNFVKAFKEVEGMTPGEWQRINLKPRTHAAISA